MTWRVWALRLFAGFWIPLISFAWPGGISGEGGSLYHSSLDRFGVNVAIQYGAISSYDVGRLRLGWYLDYALRERPARPNGLQYAQMIRVAAESYPPSWEFLGRAVDANRGALWLIGNEPDTRGQDYRLPADYAVIYHDLYFFIKGRDQTARLVAGNIVQPTPLRLRWLDMVLQAYENAYGQKMPVDVWGIHNQILQEYRDEWGCGIPPGIVDDQGQLYSVEDNANIEIFRQHIVAFREWMLERGYREKPLVITEYGVLMPSEYLGGGDAEIGDQVVREFMIQSFDYLLSARDAVSGYPTDGNRLVQQWAWYSLNDRLIDLDDFEAGGYNGALYDWRYPGFPGTLTTFGEIFSRYTWGLASRDQYFPMMAKE
jgi:hypothetical protein